MNREGIKNLDDVRAAVGFVRQEEINALVAQQQADARRIANSARAILAKIEGTGE
ncbi:hypothetical protein [Martelella limonii]|uniref:hypothetical protein n=1 Tax=Martelella limonii TaxID=1647649 RepID=UPI001580E7D4|nr:hypothetical protein [Martelella limonii]